MTVSSRSRPHSEPALLTAGFRPFFFLAGVWSAIAIPLWLAAFDGGAEVPSALPAYVWHAHEMIFGYALAAIAGFLLTAIPNWTGRAPLRGAPLAGLAALWIAGRLGVLFSQGLGAAAATAIDLAFPVLFLATAAREIVAGKSWRNLPVLGALSLLLLGSALVHAEALRLGSTAALGNRIGVATLAMLIAFIGGRIVPSFTRNWLAKERPHTALPAAAGRFDLVALAVAGVALALWAAAPDSAVAPWTELAGGIALAARLARWSGTATLAEPLLWILHVGYAWLALGLLLLAFAGFDPVLPATTALHALTAGAVGTMTLAVMTRATLGHSGRTLTAGPGTTVIYILVTFAAAVRVLAPLAGAHYMAALAVAGAAWTGAFGLFTALYGPLFFKPRR